MDKRKTVYVREHFRSGSFVRDYFRSPPTRWASAAPSRGAGCSGVLFALAQVAVWSVGVLFVLTIALVWFTIEAIGFFARRARSTEAISPTQDALSNPEAGQTTPLTSVSQHITISREHNLQITVEWTVMSAAGGGLAVASSLAAMSFSDPLFWPFIVPGLVGAALGLCQWQALRHRRPSAWWWASLSVISLYVALIGVLTGTVVAAIGAIFTAIGDSLHRREPDKTLDYRTLPLFLSGCAHSVLPALFLQKRGMHIWLWLLASTIAWTCSGAMLLQNADRILLEPLRLAAAGALAGGVYGVITGFALSLILTPTPAAPSVTVEAPADQE